MPAGSFPPRTAAPSPAARAAARSPAPGGICVPTRATPRRASADLVAPGRRSQRHAVLPDGDLTEAVAFVLGLRAAARDVEHQLVQLRPQLLERAGPERDGPRVEVDPARLLRGE